MKKMISIILFSLAAAGQISAMQPIAARSAGQLFKHYSKKMFSGTMTFWHWNIALGESFVQGIKQAIILNYENEVLQKFNNANQCVTQFITTELENTHHRKIDGVKIDHTKQGLSMGTLKKHILLSKSTAQEIAEALETNDQEILNKWRGTLSHENSHIKHNDVAWRSAANIILPFITHGSVKAIRNILPIAKKTRPFLQEQFIKIPTAIGKREITTNATMAMYRQQEQRADDEIPNDLEKLKGMRSLLIDVEKEITEKLNTLNCSPEQIEWVRWIGNFRETHPLAFKRIEKLDQRIATLEQSKKDE